MKFRNHSSRTVIANRNSLSNRGIAMLAMACLASCFITGSAHAVPFVWLANPVDEYWGNASNWDQGSVPGSTAEIEFSSSTITAVSINDSLAGGNIDRQTGGITFTGLGSFTINPGATFYLNNSTGITVNAGSPGQTFNAPTRPRVSMPITNNGTGVLQFLSSSSLMVQSGSAVTLTFGGSGDILTNKIFRRLNPGTVHIVKQDAGKLTITNAQTSSCCSGLGPMNGTATVTGGILSIDDEANLGVGPLAFTPTGLLLNGGTLEATASFTIDDATRGVSLGASNGTIDVTTGNALTIANDVTGGGSLTKSGLGALDLQGDNSYAGGTIVDTGTFSLSGTLQNANIQVNGAATMNGSGEVEFENTEVITLNGTLDAQNLLFNLNGLDITDSGKTLVDYSGGGTFNGPTELDDMLAATTTGNWTLIDTGSTVIAEFVVPEPSTLWLLGMGLVAGSIRRRRRRNG